MDFPKGATKKDKKFLKELYIKNLTDSIKSDEKTVRDFEDQIKQSTEYVREIKKRIQKTTLLIKDAEETKVD